MSVQIFYVTTPMHSLTVYCFFIYFVSHVKISKNEHVTSYEGAQVWRTKLRSDEDVQAVTKLVEDQAISLWNLDRTKADFLIQADEKVRVNRILSARRINHTVLIMDVQRRVDFMRVEPELWNDETLRIGHRLNWKEYPTFRVIDEYLVYLSENFASICNVSTIGFTAENRPIKVVKISNGNPENVELLIISGMHAREWIAITSALYLIDKIVTRFDQLPCYMKTIEWTIIPVLNPDGYEYSHTHDRLWRKNRRKLQNCRGVDINRNFDVNWDVAGITDKNECYEAYSGPHAFSEAESIALLNMIMKLNKKPDAVIDLHTYGQFILYPWSAKPGPTAHRKRLWTTAMSMANTIYNTTGKKYKFGASYHMVYPATGAALDWLYSSGVALSFAIQLSDQGNHGFLVPSENIEPIGLELLAAVKELLKELDPEFMKKRDMYGSWF